MKKRITTIILAMLIALTSIFSAGCGDVASTGEDINAQLYQILEEAPADSQETYAVINDNVPQFDKADMEKGAFEIYSDLDSLGRCGTAYAKICRELMPTEKRGSIGQVKPSGWHTVRYDDLISDKYLYNRCHLIGFQLAGENANEKNLITGTRYMNVDGMLPFEDQVADYVKETGNSVLYRVTPIFEGDDLVARGVQMEAYSVEDEGKGVCFNVFVYNLQPGITIDYATGESMRDGEEQTADVAQAYIINTNSKKFHLPECSGAKNTKAANKQEVTETRSELIAQGYEPCGSCNP